MSIVLVCRLAWMETYSNLNEPAFANHSYVKNGNTPHEALNFLATESGEYFGYVRVGSDAKGNPGKINITKLGASNQAISIKGILIIFIARRPIDNSLLIVGYYKNAEIFRAPITRPDDKNGLNSIVRFKTRSATLIKESKRCFEIPSGKGAIGNADLWYGLANDSDNRRLKNDVLKYIKKGIAPKNQNSVIESKSFKSHRKIERKSNVRRFIYDKLQNEKFICESCNWSKHITEKNIWGSSFELHHLSPISALNINEKRKVTADDFSILCSTCHRAIHRTEFISDIQKFKNTYKK